MTRILSGAAAVLLAGAFAAADEGTFTAKIFVGGMTWAGSWGGKVTRALKGLDGASNVELSNFDEGLFDVTFKDTSKVKPSDIKAALGSFELKRVELAIAGDVAKDDAGLWLVAKGSGTKYLLANRSKKDDADKPEDVVAKLEGWLKEGRKSVKVAGAAVEKDDKLTLHLASAELVEAKK